MEKGERRARGKRRFRYTGSAGEKGGPRLLGDKGGCEGLRIKSQKQEGDAVRKKDGFII